MNAVKSILLFLFVKNVYALNYYPFFYQPRTFWGEPRLVKKWLTTIEAPIRGGHALDGFDGCGNKCDALALYGCENIYALAKNVPSCFLAGNSDSIFTHAYEYENRSPSFGKLAVSGKFSSLECIPVLTQNFKYGFFMSVSVPIKKVCVRDLFFSDCSSKKSRPAGISYTQWQQAINNFEEELCRYGVYVGPTKNVGLGDIQLFGGWTLNYEHTTAIDFIDLTVATGVNFPTSRRPLSCTPWVLPLGYEEHTGIPLLVAASLGIFDWCTIGLQGGALWFNTITRTAAVQTAAEQQGWIRLARFPVREEKGAIWHIDTYLKLDHLIGGFSCVFGFSHDHAYRTLVTPCCCENNVLVGSDWLTWNSNEHLQPWTMTAFHFMLEADFASFAHPRIPHIAFTVDKTMSGKRACDSTIFGAYVAIDLA